MPVWLNNNGYCATTSDNGYHYYTTTSACTGIVFRNCTMTNAVTITNCTTWGGNVRWYDWDDEPQPIHPIEPVRPIVRRPTPVHIGECAKRAAELLVEHLTEEQRKMLKERRWFIVQGGRTGKSYRIERGRGLIANIAVLEGDRVDHRLCAHLRTDIPEDDHLLAQKLWLEHAEDEFVQRANRHAAAA